MATKKADPAPQPDPAIPPDPEAPPLSEALLRHIIPDEFTYVQKQSGRLAVQYEGLLYAAHIRDFQGFTRAEVMELPTKDNGMTFAVQCAAIDADGHEWWNYGDASPENVTSFVKPHFRRMAITRAHARCLRDMLNIGAVAVDETSSMENDDFEPIKPRPGAAAEHGREAEQYGERQREHTATQPPKASPYKPASANQLATIAKLSRLLGAPEEPDQGLTSAEASERITELSREYNERKSSAGRRSA